MLEKVGIFPKVLQTLRDRKQEKTEDRLTEVFASEAAIQVDSYILPFFGKGK